MTRVHTHLQLYACVRSSPVSLHLFIPISLISRPSLSPPFVSPLSSLVSPVRPAGQVCPATVVTGNPQVTATRVEDHSEHLGWRSDPYLSEVLCIHHVTQYNICLA